MNIRLKPEECTLEGKWEVTENDLIADAISKRIGDLIANELTRLAASADGWSVLYQDKHDGRYWELSYPSSELHGGGAPTLTCLGESEAKSQYGV